MSWILKVNRSLLIFFVALLCYFVAERRTDGFRTFKIISKLKVDDQFAIASIKEEDILEAKKIFEQNFIYLGRGRQYFVFQSSDGNYVIKFLNQNNFSYPPILNRLTFIKSIDKLVKRKEGKVPLTFGSMKLSFEKLKDEARLIYVNLSKERKINKSLKIINKYGATFFIDLDSTYFVLQKKVFPFFPTLERIYEREKEVGLQKAIDSYLKLISSRCIKNIADDDFNIKDNIGFEKDIPVIVDTGRLYYKDHLTKKDFMLAELNRSTKILKKWLMEYHIKQISFLEDKIKYYIDSDGK